MARTKVLTAELKPRQSDVAIPDVLLPKIPPFSLLKATAKLANFPGSVILRRFRKGEVICEQGDPGWTAFYIPTTSELAAIREAPKAQLTAADAELAKTEAKVGELEKQLAEAAGDPKKTDSLRGKVAEAHEQIAEQKERVEVFRAAVPYLERTIPAADSSGEREAMLSAGVSATDQLRKARSAAETGGDAAKAALLGELLSVDPARKRKQADAVATSDPDLAGWLRESARTDEARRVASVRLRIQLPRSTRSPGLLGSVKDLLTGRKRRAPAHRPSSIPIDGPVDLDYETREGVLNEGELFGEMSCLYRSPRSATVVAARDCFVLEMLRNVLDAMSRDAGFKARLDQTYRDRVLAMQLRNIPILDTLDNRLLERVRQRAELIDFPAGGILYDEHDVSDSMHLIRSGIVKVMLNVSYLLGEEDITDWPGLLAALADENGPLEALRARLPEGARPSSAELSSEAKSALIDCLNEVIKDPDLVLSAPFRAVALAHHPGRMVWQRLADPRRTSERELLRCQRLLVDSLYAGKVPEWSRPAADDEPSYTFRIEEFRDWKAAGTAIVDGGAKEGDPRRRVWELLPVPVQAALREAKAGKEPVAELKTAIVDALNEVLSLRPLLLDPLFQDHVRAKKPAKLVMEFLPNNETWGEFDYQRFGRAYNRFLLDLAVPRGLGNSRRPEGPPRTLAYRARGETIGEMSLFMAGPRMATCVAFGHPEDDPEREVGPVQLVRIGKDLFEELRKESPEFHRQVSELVAQRRAETASKAAPTRPSMARALPQIGRAEELGLFQGQKLMLIDLDRCTRCDECVRACVNTHDDGHSRLFLDGPRFGKYLVPATCRSCLDPVCMIGCPVGSIHRGGNGEIIIEDWCIGCELCAGQCPYGSIQMHKNGIIPGSAYGWRYQSASAVPGDWFQPSFRERDWPIGAAPFVHDRVFRETLGLPPTGAPAKNGTGDSVCFRYHCEIEAELLRGDHHFILALTSMDEDLSLWINGKPVVAPASAAVKGVEVSKKKSRDNGWWEFEAEFPRDTLRVGQNLVAVQVTARASESDRLLDLRVDREEGTTVKLVEQQAVVCDLCSAQFGKVPACVTACPHDAAIRIDALSQLPTM